MESIINKERIDFFQENILFWYKKNGRNFPWRKSSLSNYQKVISEVLLQRTKAETVAKFYPGFISKFPSWNSLAEMPLCLIEESLKPIGLQKQRAPKLKNLALEMVERNGRFPKERENLEGIPFIGQYIANAILLLIHDQPEPLLDVNMARVLERFFGSRKLADIRHDPYLQELSHKIVNHKESKKISWGILDFAALGCKSKYPLCKACIFKPKCNYYFKNQISSES